MEQLDRAAARALLPRRAETAAKWSFGRAMLLCGSERFSGAALLSAEAALRSGAGLVQLCSAPAVIAAARVRLPEALLGELSGSDGESLSPPARQLLQDGLERASALLFGCGAGLSRRARELLALALEAPLPLVLDADGLNLLAERPELLARRRAPTLLTPHAGEFCRLSGLTRQQLEDDPAGAALDFARRHSVSLALKGSATWLTDGSRLLRLNAPNSGMAKGGSGDVLAGLCAGLAAQGMELFSAAALACWLHGEAGALARLAMGPRAMLPRDVLAALPQAFLSLEQV